MFYVVLAFAALARLFAPPVDLIEPLELDKAKEKGAAEDKWILVNIQKIDEFECQTLNRDIWNNAEIQDLVKMKFLFWQRQHNTRDAERYMQYYKLDGFPHIAILEPHTGQRVKTFAQHQNPGSFLDQMWAFLEEHNLSGDLEGTPKANGAEQQHLKEAVAASLGKKVPALDFEEDQHLYAADSPISGESLVLSSDEDGSGDDDDAFTAFGEDTSQAAGEMVPPDSQDSVVDSAPADLELAPEPPDNSELPFCTIRFVFPDNAKMQRRFLLTETIRSLQLFVDEHHYRHEIHDLVFGFPAQNLKNTDKDTTLASLGMKRETVHVQAANV
jgi:hypothetical protein